MVTSAGLPLRGHPFRTLFSTGIVLVVAMASIVVGAKVAGASHVKYDDTYWVDDDGFIYISNTGTFCDGPAGSPGDFPADSRVVDDASGSTSNSIQNAVDAAGNDGDDGTNEVVRVCPGTYEETVTIDVPGLTMEGPKAEVHARARMISSTGERCEVGFGFQATDPCLIGDRGQEASIQGQERGGFVVVANNVTVDGFLFEQCTNPSDGATCAGVSNLPPAGFGTYSGHQILNSIFQDNILGIYFRSTDAAPALGVAAAPSLIAQNFFLDNNIAGPVGGNGIYADKAVNVTIHDNSFLNNTSSSINLAGNGPATSAVTNRNVTATNNQWNTTMTLTDTEDSLVAHNQAAAVPGYGIDVAGNNHDVRFFQNDVRRSNAAGIAVSHRFKVVRDANGNVTSSFPNSGIAIESNTLVNNANGIGVFEGAVASPADLVIRFNRIAGNSNAGLLNEVAPIAPATTFVVAENNWWGCNEGPEAGVGGGCNVVSTTVDARPWLVLRISKNVDTLRPGQSALITASVTQNEGGATSEDTSGTGLFIPQGTPIRFTTDRGVLSHDTVGTDRGVAQVVVTQTSNTTPGIANVTAHLDAEQTTTSIEMLEATAVAPGVPTITISDATVAEGNGGTGDAVFNVALSRPASGTETITVGYSTADGSARAGEDYTPTSGQLTFFGNQGSQQIRVPIVADTNPEPNEVFFVNLTAPVGAAIIDDQGLGTIVNDDQVGQPAPQPSPSPSPSPSPTPTATPTPRPTATASPSPSASPTPTPTETSPPNPSPTGAVARELTFGLRGHLRAFGTLRSFQGASQCHSLVPVKIQRWNDGRWRTVKKVSTKPDGSFDTRLRDRRGTYRALAPRHTPDAATTCLRAKSRAQKHRHR